MMATTNDVTGDSLITKASTDNYRSNYDAIFKKNKQEFTPEAIEQAIIQKIEEQGGNKGHCFECLSPEGFHKMGCGSKSVYDAYITLRDSDKWRYFTDVMLTEFDNKVRSEQTERKYSNMFDGMSDEEGK